MGVDKTGKANTNKVRIKDVAEHAGVSVATITRVINSSGYVSEKTRARVEATIQELGYIPNLMASALKNNSTRIIGNLVPESDFNPFFTNVGAAIGSSAAKCDYHIMTMVTKKDENKERSLLNELVGRMVEGIIFTGDVITQPENIQVLLNKGIPVIMVERPLDLPGVDKVLINDLEGSSQAAHHFLELGHTRFGYIGAAPERGTVEVNRFDGFRQTLHKAGIRLEEKYTIMLEDYKVELGYHAMRRLLSRPGLDADRPTAYFITSDILACGALQYLYEKGLRVPQDISLIGYDNTLSSVSSPPLSTMAFPIKEIGDMVIDMLLERREQNRSYGKSVQLSPYLIDRGTVRDLRTRK